MDLKSFARRRRFDILLWCATIVIGLVYVGNRWCPSSYSIVLNALGEKDTGLVAGTPRAERGDEFGWHTPLFQMVVRSGFGRYDLSPPFHEDLRTLYGLPVLDWGLLFKPNVWGFLFLSPAVAYSAYEFSLIALCLLGFAYLFRSQGGSPGDALLLSLAIFFTAYTQYWWNGFSNFFLSAFPWVALASLSASRSVGRAALFYWVTTSAVLVYFYPPVALSFTFVVAILLLAYRPGALRGRSLPVLCAAGLAAGGTAVLYLHEAIEKLSRTVFPGHRVAAGGGVGFDRWLTQFLPTALIDSHHSLTPANVCEISVIGSSYLLIVLVFLDYRTLAGAQTPREVKRSLAILVAGLLAVWAWMLLPLPSWVGYPLLWHRVPPGRIVVAAGVLSFSAAFLAARSSRLLLTPMRIAFFAAVVFGGWYHYKWSRYSIGLDYAWRDVVIVAPVLVIAAWNRFRPFTSTAVHRSLLGASVIVGVVSFGDFNPLQIADPLFSRHDTPVTRAFDAQLATRQSPYLVVPFRSGFFGHSGQTLIGLGYPSVGHATFAPKLGFFRKLFPEMPEGLFQSVFNNAGVFAVDGVDEPYRMEGTLVTVVPIKVFGRRPCDRPGEPSK